MVHWFNRHSGQLVVLLHGFTGSVHAWCEVAAHLPDDVSVAALAVPGHHPKVLALPDFEGTCDAVAQAIVSLGAPAVHLVGYSLGARLSLGIALRHPKLLARMSLVGGHIGLEHDDVRRERALQDAQWVRLLENEGIEQFVQTWEAQPVFASQNSTSQKVLQAQRQRRLCHDAKALAQSLRSTGLSVMPNYWPALENNVVPVQFIVGREDKKFLTIAQRACALSPQARLSVIDGCGHNPLIEAPQPLASLLMER